MTWPTWPPCGSRASRSPSATRSPKSARPRTTLPNSRVAVVPSAKSSSCCSRRKTIGPTLCSATRGVEGAMLKRVVTGVIALTVLIACYLVYARAFGGIALPPLPPGQGPPSGAGPFRDAETPDFARNVAAKVFGKDSWQAKADIALYWRNRGVIIFVADYKQIA